MSVTAIEIEGRALSVEAERGLEGQEVRGERVSVIGEIQITYLVCFAQLGCPTT